jgi:parvulin-like peptidyl-prolyl isomerase
MNHIAIPTPRAAPAVASHGRLCLFFALGLALVWAGCTDRNVVAVVGDTELNQADLATFQSQRTAGPAAEQLEALIDRQLLAEAASEDNLLKDPQIRARAMAAQREILAHALLERRLGTATSESALRERFEREKTRLVRKQIHVAQIAVGLPHGDPALARRAARTPLDVLYSQLVAGESFDQLARKASEDRVSAERGGDLGPIKEGQVDATFFAAAAELKQGKFSKPFETPFGFHIVKAIDDPTVVTPKFEELRSKLAADSRREAEAKLLAELKEKIKVKRYPNHLPAAPRAEVSNRGGGMQ